MTGHITWESHVDWRIVSRGYDGGASELRKVLDAYGEQGWRIVQVLNEPDAPQFPQQRGFLVTFERQVESTGRVTWEYKVLEGGMGDWVADVRRQALETNLNILGGDGWELVYVEHVPAATWPDGRSMPATVLHVFKRLRTADGGATS